MKNCNKIHIIGEVGSGKTYLAEKLSKQLDINYYQLDNVVWRRGEESDTRNSQEVRDAILGDIVNQEKWIIEGVHYKWVQRCFESADIIIYLETNVFIRDIQMLKRYFKQKLGLEKGNYNQTIKNLYSMVVWNHKFESERKPIIDKILHSYDYKVQKFKSNKHVR
ncbi:hypothetical protein BK120_28865 [Paenibacillus sp. FSL A5-0031]|uniref:hypothetical protein n=1 Tax=Paenibacillus sp. FSL A5-0031 TaxID=1920420 RepID=UPI00096F2947|nr:hypothetical protein [Paenibacillus sp. FSL A5-0031]OME76515.1 hypothetical protein BK120_28865 [Paenibacillus sp. FSL A5-0031]